MNTKQTNPTPVAEIKKGDRFIVDSRELWEAVDDARTETHDGNPLIVVRVRYRDGGLGDRVWEAETNQKLEIERS